MTGKNMEKHLIRPKRTNLESEIERKQKPLAEWSPSDRRQRQRRRFHSPPSVADECPTKHDQHLFQHSGFQPQWDHRFSIYKLFVAFLHFSSMSPLTSTTLRKKKKHSSMHSCELYVRGVTYSTWSKTAHRQIPEPESAECPTMFYCSQDSKKWVQIWDEKQSSSNESGSKPKIFISWN